MPCARKLFIDGQLLLIGVNVTAESSFMIRQLTGNALHEIQKSKTCYDGPAILLDSVEDAGNVGSILRLAEAFGCRRVYFTGERPSFSSSRLKSMSMGCAEYLNLTVNFDPEFLQDLVAVEITDCSTSMFTEQLLLDDVLVVGNERHGISQRVLDLCKKSVHIPMFGVKGSMNVANALAIALYECRRQNNEKASLAAR